MTAASLATLSSLRPMLSAGLRQMDLELSPMQQAQLLQYVSLLDKWNKVYNLTAVREVERMVGLHILDSLSVARHLGPAKAMIDVGTGGGLPGLPLAIARPGLSVVLLDTIAKKTIFVREVIGQLSLANATPVTNRVEQHRPDKLFDIVISRAFSELKDFVESAGHLCAAGGRMLAMKGVYPHDEIARLPAGFSVDEVITLNVPQVDGQRHLLVISKR